MYFFSDVNECATGEHTCHGNATCKNVFGSFRCNCNEGYEGNGQMCSGEGITAVEKLIRYTLCKP